MFFKEKLTKVKSSLVDKLSKKMTPNDPTQKMGHGPLDSEKIKERLTKAKSSIGNQTAKVKLLKVKCNLTKKKLPLKTLKPKKIRSNDELEDK